MCFLMLLSFYYMVRIYQDNGKMLDYALASLFLGLAIQAKLPAIVLFVPFLMSHVVICRKNSLGWVNIIYNQRILYAMLFFSVGFVLGNPAIVVKPIAFLQSGFGLKTLEKGKDVYDFKIDGWTYYLRVLFNDIGIIGFMLCISGLIVSIVKPRFEHLLITILAVCYYILMAQENKLVFARYMIPLVSILTFAAALGLETVLKFFKTKTQYIIVAAVISLHLIIVFPNIYAYSASLYGKNTRYIAKDWIEQNIPAGTKILLQTGRSINSDSPPIHQTKSNIEHKINEIKNFLQNKSGTFDAPGMVDKNAIVYYELLLKTTPAIAYDITSTEFYRNIQSFEYYVRNEFKFAIIKSDSQDFYVSDIGKKSNLHLHRFFSQLRLRGKLLKEFRPDEYHSGERFRIYAF